MAHQKIRTRARELVMPHCRVCPDCNGVTCRGEVPFMGWDLDGCGKEGVAMYIERLKQELTGTMLLTGAASISEITPERVHRN